MVSVGTILTLGIVAAVGIAGYAIYSNLGKVGTAVSSTVTKSVSDPFSDWLDTVIGPSQNGGGTGGGGALPSLPEAQAPTPQETPGITPTQAQKYEAKYLPGAQKSAKLILESFAPSSQAKLITTATAIAEKSATPALTQAYSIVDQARVSVGGAEPLTNKFYRLFTLANKPYYDKVLPLSREAVQFYATKGVIAREVYL